jgi:hypothetical protein
MTDTTFTILIVLDAKYLGCLITSDLRWTNHTNRICGNANKTPSGIGTHFNKTLYPPDHYPVGVVCPAEV